MIAVFRFRFLHVSVQYRNMQNMPYTRYMTMHTILKVLCMFQCAVVVYSLAQAIRSMCTILSEPTTAKKV